MKVYSEGQRIEFDVNEDGTWFSGLYVEWDTRLQRHLVTDNVRRGYYVKDERIRA